MKHDDEELRIDHRNLDALFVLAALNALHGQYRAALRCINRLEEIDPAHPGLVGLKAKICDLMGDTKTAARYWAMLEEEPK